MARFYSIEFRPGVPERFQRAVIDAIERLFPRFCERFGRPEDQPADGVDPWWAHFRFSVAHAVAPELPGEKKARLAMTEGRDAILVAFRKWYERELAKGGPA